jgi:molybdopterin-synthase adenylyltransferase
MFELPVPDQLPSLTDEERAVYGWQLDVGGFGEESQRRLKAATVMISRVGGLGGTVAWQLAAAGIGHLVLAHAGNIKPSDLNRQTLMTQDRLGSSRLDSAVERLRALNPRLNITAIPENVRRDNACEIAREADVVVDCAPLFDERFALNHAAVTLRKPMVECAVFDLEFHLTTLVPGRTPCLRCLYPEANTWWTRRFPVLGAVPGVAGAMAALEVIKLVTGMSAPLAGRLLTLDLRSMELRRLRVRRLPGCSACGHLPTVEECS